MVESRWPRGRSSDGGIDDVALPADRGALSLCGKHAVGRDPEHALRRAGATTVVCLNERHELADRYPDYVAWLATEEGARALWRPIPDLHAPPLPAAEVLVGELRRRLDLGERLLVHCGAGIGRAGTIATCLLVDLGLDLPAALALVAASRPTAGPEVGAQRDLVESFAASRRTGARRGGAP